MQLVDFYSGKTGEHESWGGLPLGNPLPTSNPENF